jgi:uncharacterized membrane protein
MTMQSNPLPSSTPRTGAIAAFAVAGLLWTGWLAGILDALTHGHLYLVLWLGSAVVLWFLVLEELRAPDRSAFAVAVKWWVLTLFGPFGVAYALYARSTSSAAQAAQPRPAAPSRYAAQPLGLETRVTLLERRVSELQATIDELRAGRPVAPSRAPAAAPTPTPAPPRPTPPPAPQPAYARLTPPAATPPPSTKAGPTAPPPRGFDWGRSISLEDLMGAKTLAFTGGVVTLLGVVFFFVLAVNRGWIGPGIRVGCGAFASALVFAAGIWLQRRYEATYSSLAAVGVGIAGAYTTLLAAVSLYDMVSKPVALVIAAGIASIGVAVSLAWGSEVVAAFGLIGAMIVPATLVFQGGLQEIGTAFVAVVFAGAAVVAVRERWWTMLQIAALVSSPQALAQANDAAGPHVGIVTLTAVFWLLYLAAAVAFQLRLGPALAAAPASFLTGSALFAGVSAAILYGQRDGGLQQGIAQLAAASAYVVLAAVLYRRARELATVLWAIGLAIGAIGLAEALSGSALTYAWAAEAALLVWLSSRVRDARFQLPALAYLGLALLHGLAFEGSPDHLFRAMRHPAEGAPAMLAIALAAVVYARVTRSWTGEKPATGILRALDPALAWLRARDRAIDVTAYSLAAVFTAYAASLGILELFQYVWSGGNIETPFEWGHVAITAVWCLGWLVAVVLAVRRRSVVALTLSFGWLALTAGKVVAFDVRSLSETRYSISLLIIGTAALLAGLVRELTSDTNLTGEGVGAILFSLISLVAGALVLVPSEVAGIDGNGVVLVCAGALYTTLAAGAFARPNRRDLTTLLWILGLGVAAVGEGILLDGVWLVLAWTLTAALLAVISVPVEERRLQVASLVYLVFGTLVTLAEETPPSQLLVAHLHPGHGLASLVLVIAATATVAWSLGWNERYRFAAICAAGTLTVYGASLAILEAMLRISPQGVQTDFQRGHTAVSAFWGLLALVSLYVGLKKRRGVLRVGGFILFAISLGKIFLYDLPSLSSVQRALSFLAVGAVLLLGGFFYQRLSAQFDDRLT